MADYEDAAFDKIMELVGNDGKFQRVFNNFYNIALVCFASMSFMNIVLILNEPEHTCKVPGRENFNMSIGEWKNLTLPMEKDNRDTLSQSTCKMYNTTLFMDKPIENWHFTENDTISCIHGYDYDKQWYERTIVSDEDWVCEKGLFQTNIFVMHRIGEVVGTFFFGQLGDTAGRRPVFYFSAVIIIIGRVMSIFVSSVYWLYAAASIISMLTSMSIFLSPLIIAMETSREEERAKITMLQCVGWTLGMSIMPLVFWAVRDWVWFLMLTTLPIGLFTLYPKYMIESPRWLATKRHFKRCAVELNRIAKINGKKVEITEEMLEEMMPKVKVEEVYGIASLFTGWRLAKNTTMIVICWTITSIIYFVLILNSTRMGGNPFLSFLYQSAIELPAFATGKWMSDRYGRRFTNSISFLIMGILCIPVIIFIINPELQRLTIGLFVAVKFCTGINFFAVNLQSMEIYPTCLRQSGIAAGTIIANILAVFGPYIVRLGTEYDVRYPYIVLGVLCVVGLVAAMFLPETLHHNLPNTLHEAKKFGKEQKFWFLPKERESHKEKEPEVLEKLNAKISEQIKA